MKKLLTNSLVLKTVDPDKEFVVCIDTCKRGIGGVLMQEGHVVCYESWKLNEREQKCVTHDIELVAIIHSLKMSRHYLIGRRFIFMRNHHGLRYLFD